jgi:hypothetical protein
VEQRLLLDCKKLKITLGYFLGFPISAVVTVGVFYNPATKYAQQQALI